MKNYRRIRRAIIAGVGLATLTLGTASLAGAATPVQWDQSTSTVTVVIPPGSVGTYELYVNAPATGTVLGTDSGTSGVLTVVVPPYCGEIQADVLVNGQFAHGRRFSDDSSCTTPPTTTTTTSTTQPTTTTSAAPPAVVTTSSVPPAPPAGPVTETLTGPVPMPSTSASATGPLLPYTGANYPLLATLAGVLIPTGLLLMRRRGLKWGRS
jgi:hypothetical protein